MPTQKDYYRDVEKSREQGRKDAALYRERYPERARASSRASQKKHKKQRSLDNAKWMKKNFKVRKEYQGKYYKDNRSKLAEKQVEYRRTHKAETKVRNKRNYLLKKEEIKRANALYQKENPEKTKVYRAKRRTSKTLAGGQFTAREWKSLCNLHDNRCLCCGKKKKLEADHIVPVSKGGTSNIENIQPLCRSCNAKKGVDSTDYRGKGA